MLRRSIISAVAGSAVATVLTVSAQTAKAYRIGWLSRAPLTATPQIPQVFHQGMRERGWIAKRSYVIENRHSDQDCKAERVPVFVAEIVRSSVELIISRGTQRLCALAAGVPQPLQKLPLAINSMWPLGPMPDR